jgi:hypothetical protein
VFRELWALETFRADAPTFHRMMTRNWTASRWFIAASCLILHYVCFFSLLSVVAFGLAEYNEIGEIRELSEIRQVAPDAN